ncbi:MAG TPA: hypothetical protein VF681_14170 [Abditibacteriaceae bacterium]|jgi:hypothetical protein
MKFDRTLWAALALGGATVTAAHAWPNTSPSAREAARLKHRPPRNWLQHYLPDDRYKIAGGVWKVVSTQYDTYYHRPDSPLMLRQPASIVIGFSSEQEAIDAGYRRASGFGSYGGSGSGRASVAGDANTTVNRSRRAVRIRLADGRSTILLPPQWRRTRTGAQTVAGYASLSDTIQPLRGGNYLRISFINAPGNVNAAPFLTPANFTAGFKALGRNATPAAQAIVNNSNTTAARVGPLTGVRLSPKTAARTPGLTGRNIVLAARGSKIYAIDMPSNNSAARIVASLQPN